MSWSHFSLKKKTGRDVSLQQRETKLETSIYTQSRVSVEKNETKRDKDAKEKGKRRRRRWVEKLF